MSERIENSTKPFGEALRELRGFREKTMREVSAATKKLDRRGISIAYLCQLEKGTVPTPEAMTLIARALDADPEYFAEYRLLDIQRHFAWEREGGLAAALAEAEQYERWRAERRRRPRPVAA